MIEIKRTPTPSDEELKIRQLETNIRNYDAWHYKHYPLTKEEADVVLRLIKNYEETGGNKE